jgi:class 3 adenylate cyclase
MIRPSPELLAVSRRWYKGIVTRNTGILRDYLSPGEELRFIGTGQDEYWNGAAVRDGIGDFFEVIPDVESIEELEAEAYENGDTGWSSFVHRTKFAGFPDASIFRDTLIFVLAGAGWKIVHRHSSVPTPNIEVVGSEQPAIQRLVDAARNEGPALKQTEGFASVLFTDLEGSAKLTAALGDRRWTALIDDHFQALMDIVKTHRGQFVKSLGDGTMSSFPSANDALTAAIAMQRAVASAAAEPRLGLRIGVHSGDVMQARGDFFGTVVNMAARITAAATSGEILISDATRVMVGGTRDFHFTDTISAPFKGFEGQHVIHRLEWVK